MFLNCCRSKISLLVNTILLAHEALIKMGIEEPRIAEPLDGPSVMKIRELARELKVDLMLGFLERDGDILFRSDGLKSAKKLKSFPPWMEKFSRLYSYVPMEMSLAP